MTGEQQTNTSDAHEGSGVGTPVGTGAGTAVGTAHAKSILLGEHSVVYQKPAIAFPVRSLELRATVTPRDEGLYLVTPYHAGSVAARSQAELPLERLLSETALRNTLSFIGQPQASLTVEVAGLIPPARGLGSSAAVAAAIAKAVARFHGIELSASERFDIVQSVERVAHGTPSGLDAYATTADGPIWFDQGQVTRLELATVPPLVIADTGVRGHTSEAVGGVRARYEKHPAETEQLLDELSQLTSAGRESLLAADFAQLGNQMNAAHAALTALGVSSNELDTLTLAANNAGALGAKLTGGGLGGCIVALAAGDDRIDHLATALKRAGAIDVWAVSGEGSTP